MRFLRPLAFGSLLLFAGCTLLHKTPKITTVSPTPVMVTTTSLNTANTDLFDEAAGYNAADFKIISLLPPSRIKDAALEVTSDQAYVLGNPKPATKTKFENWALDLISADAAKVASAEAERDTLAGQIDTLKTQIDDLKASQTAQLATLKDQNAVELANVQAKAKSDADAKEKEIISYIFFGLAAICLLGAVAVGMLAASYPLFGPKAAVSLGLAGVVSGATGVALLKLLDVSVVYWGVGGIVLLISIALVLVYSNHAHAQTPTNVPVKP